MTSMPTDHLFDDPEHFEEGLVHLADMLELADPRREGAKQSQANVLQTGVTVPVGGTLDDWKEFCLKVASGLEATRGDVPSDDGLAALDAAVDRIRQMAE